MAVSALSGEDMRAAGIQNMDDISRQVPALEVQTNNSTIRTNFRIRRIGNLGNIPTFEPAVGVFIDGAFRSNSIFAATELFDLDRIEVLRGPQSTLYGKNTTAGVIGIYTAAPADEFLGRAELSIGNIDGGKNASSFNFTGGVSGPISDTLRGSLGVSYIKSDDYMKQALANGGGDANGKDRYSVRGQLAWDASDELSFRLILGTVQEDDRQLSPDITFDPNGFLAALVLPTWQAFGISDTCSDNDPHNHIGCQIDPHLSDLSALEATLLTSYALTNGMTLTAVTSWDHFDNESQQQDALQMLTPALHYVDNLKNNAFQQELQLTSAGGENIDWLAGLFYYTSEFYRGDKGKKPIFYGDTFSAHPMVSAINQALLGLPFPLPVATPGQLAYHDSKLSTDYFAIFGQATWNISDNFSITAGLRWQEEKKDAYIHQSVNDPSPSIISLLLSPPAVSGDDLHRSTNEVTWSISPQWSVSETTMLFATAAHGFKSGGFNTGFGGIPISDREFADEDIMNYEAGVKSDLMDGRLRLAASVFYADYKDYQDAAFVGSQFTVGNAKSAELKGLELEGKVLLSERLIADFAVSYADFTYKTNTTGQCYPGRVPDSPTTPGACDLSGDHPVNAPEWKTHVGLLYQQPVSWGDVYGRFDWSWTDDYNTSFSSDPRLVQKAYSWLNLRAGTHWDNYELSLWVTNMTNETIANFDAVVNVYAGDGSYQSFLQMPRTYGLTLRINF